MITTTRRRVLAGAAATAALLAVGGTGADATRSQPMTAAPTAGGTATIFTHADLETGLDPWTASISPGTSMNQLVAVYDTLIRLDSEGNVIPRLAESVEPNDDFTVWTITLRDGLVFTDGTPLDSAAVKYNWELHQDPDNASIGQRDAQKIASIETPDDTTVVATLVEPGPTFPIALTGSIGMIGSPTAIEAAGGIEGFGQQPVAAGPFKLAEWVHGDRMTLERNDTFWDAPKPYLDGVIFQPVPDVTQRTDAFIQGEADIIFYPTISPDVARLRDEGYDLVSAPLWGGTGVVFNVTEPPFDDVRVRKAFALSLDPDLISLSASDGAAQPVTTIFPEGSPYFVADLVQQTNRPEDAQALIDEYVAETGGPVQIRFVYGQPTAPFAEAAGQQFDALDDVEVELEVASDFITRLQEGDFNASISALNGNDPEPNIRRLTTDFPGNYGGYSNPEIDALVEQGGTVGDVSERATAYERLQDIVLNDDVPFVWLWRTQYLSAANDTIMGLQAFDAGEIDIAELWKPE